MNSSASIHLDPPSLEVAEAYAVATRRQDWNEQRYALQMGRPVSRDLEGARTWFAAQADALRMRERTSVELAKGLRIDWLRGTHALRVDVVSTKAEDLRAALECVLGAMADIDLLCARVKPRDQFDFFALEPVFPDGAVRERAFFEACIAESGLRPLVAEVVRSIIRWTKAAAFGKRELWSDERHPAGSIAAALLALASVEYVPLFIEHLASSDLNHESFHERLIDRLIATHGWNDATMELIAFRSGIGSAQSDGANLERAVAHHGLRAHLDARAAHDDFIRMLIAWQHDGTEDLEAAGSALYEHDEAGYLAWISNVARVQNKPLSTYELSPISRSAGWRPFDHDERDWDS